MSSNQSHDINTTSINATSEIVCGPWYSLEVGASLEPLAYITVPCIFLSLGLLIRCVCLLAFYRQSKKERAYSFQVLIVILETLKVFPDAAYSVVMVFCWGFNSRYVSMASTNYALYWYASHLAIISMTAFWSASLLMACFMAADRYRALSHPFEYAQQAKIVSQWRKYILPFLFSVCLAIGMNCYDAFRYQSPSVSSRGTYQLVPNTAFMQSLLGNILVCLRNTIQSISLVVMIVLNLLVVRLVRRQKSHMRKAAQRENPEEKRKRKVMKNELVLASITVLECSFITIAGLVNISYVAAVYFWPTFEACESILWTPVMDMISMMLSKSQLYFVILLNRRLRKIIFENTPMFQKLRVVSEGSPCF